MEEGKLTQEQEEALRNLKRHFPYRIVFGVIKEDGVFETWAKTDRRKLNAFVRQGYSVFVLD